MVPLLSFLFLSLITSAQPKVIKIANTEYHSCSLFETGKVKCWGGNFAGNLGLGHKETLGNKPDDMGDNLPYLDLEEKAINLWVGPSVTCAQFENKKIKCWGYGEDGVLGNEDNLTLGDEVGEEVKNLPYLNLGKNFVVKELSISGHVCAMSEDKKVKCWGRNDKGQLGLGDTLDRGKSKNTMGENLFEADLGGTLVVKKVVVGYSHSCALFENGKVKCWGANKDRGFLGLGKDTNLGDEPQEMGEFLPFVNFGSIEAIDLVNAGENTCVLLKNGLVKCWGLGYFGTNGIGSNLNIGTDTQQMGENLQAVDLGKDNLVVKLEGGGYNICATIFNKTVKCWGNNLFGKLGFANGDASIGDSNEELGENLDYMDFGTKLFPDQIVMGLFSNCALFSGKVKCWGSNFSGELGSESTERLGDDAGEMGDNLPFVNLGTK